MNANPLELKLQRIFPHPRALVYEMWSDPRHVAEWFRPFDDVILEVQAFDFQEGGNYAFRYSWPDGVFPVQGTFLTIRSNETLIFTWEPQSPDPDAGKQTLVSVWFHEAPGDGTEIELRHTLFPDKPMHSRHEAGWLATLDRLSRYLSNPQTKPDKS